MELETIANVNSNYGSAEASRISTPKPVPKVDVEYVEPVMTKTVPTTSQPVPADAKGNADQQGGRQQKGHVPSEATMNDAVKKANLKMARTRCEYSYHDETNRVSIKVVDRDTDEVVREIPPEKTLDVLQKIWELAGILVDEKR